MQDHSKAAGHGVSRAMYALGALILYIYLAYAASGALSRAWRFSGDDTFITLHYARHLADGYGLRFNVTDARPTEGFSSLLHVLVMAAAFRLDAEPVIATRLVALLSFLLVPLLLAYPAHRLCRVPFTVALFSAAAAHFLFLLTTATALHLAFGLETMLFALTVACLTGWMMLELAEGVPASVRAGWGITSTFLVLLTRPEGVVLNFAALAFVALAGGARSSLAGLWRNRALVAVAACCALEAVALIAWRASYFGHVVPNPYYVKSHNAIFGSDGAFLPGLSYTLDFLKTFGLVILAGALPLALVPDLRRRAGAALWVLGPALAVVTLYARAIHEMSFGHRYEYPYLVAAELVLVCTVCCLWLRNKGLPILAALGVMILAQFRPLCVEPRDTLNWAGRTANDLALPHRYLGEDLGRTGLGNRATVLLSGAGAVPYFSDFRTVDWIGLNTSYLSGREALTMDEVWAYIDGTKPDVIYSILPPASAKDPAGQPDPALKSIPLRALLSGWSSDLFLHWNRSRLFDMAYREMAYVRDHYAFGACYKLGGEDPIWLIAYVRRDSPQRDLIAAALKSSAFADRTSDLKESYVNDPRNL